MNSEYYHGVVWICILNFEGQAYEIVYQHSTEFPWSHSTHIACPSKSTKNWVVDFCLASHPNDLPYVFSSLLAIFHSASMVSIIWEVMRIWRAVHHHWLIMDEAATGKEKEKRVRLGNIQEKGWNVWTVQGKTEMGGEWAIGVRWESLRSKAKRTCEKKS